MSATLGLPQQAHTPNAHTPSGATSPPSPERPAPDHARRVYDDVSGLLPSPENPSPLIRINRLNPDPHATLYAKLEWTGPFGSVKDRAGSYLLQDLIDRGQLRKPTDSDRGRGIVEATSGNTGLSIAALASALGYRSRMVVPAKVPLEKKALLKLAGADLDVINDSLCPSPGLGEGSIGIAKTYAKAQASLYALPNQYENQANIRAHLETTGPEIWNQTQGRITHFFATLGTCGTVTGVGRFLKAKNPAIKIYAVNPNAGHDIPGVRSVDELAAANLFDPSVVDEVLTVDHELAYTAALNLAQNEGLLAGPSSGLIFAGAMEILRRRLDARDSTPAVAVCIFCDNVFKYMTTMIKHLPQLAEGTNA